MQKGFNQQLEPGNDTVTYTAIAAGVVFVAGAKARCGSCARKAASAGTTISSTEIRQRLPRAGSIWW